MRRKGILLRVYAPTAGKRDFDKHLFDSYKHGPSSSGAWPHCPRLPTCLRFQNVPDRRGDSGYNVKGNDAPRVSVRERGRPSFQLLLNARDPTPGHSYLRLRRKCLLPSAPRVRLRTLNRTSYESRNAMTNVPTAARAASALRNFSIWGPPIESSAARARDASQGYFTAVARTTPGKRDFDKHLFDSYTHYSSSGGARPHCPGLPDVFAFSNVPDRRGDSGYNS